MSAFPPAPAPAAPGASSERLLAFELARTLYAIPIGDVLEVAVAGPVACIPTLPLELGGVVNYHGDALPVLEGTALLDAGGADAPRTQPAGEHAGHVLVIGEGASGAGRLGLPVDRVLGLIDGGPAVARNANPVAERRTLAGRVLHVIDPRRLLGRARESIEQAAGPRRDPSR